MTQENNPHQAAQSEAVTVTAPITAHYKMFYSPKTTAIPVPTLFIYLLIKQSCHTFYPFCLMLWNI